MFKKRKQTLTLKVFVLLLSLAMATAGFTANGGSARIIPSGKVSIIKEGEIVGEFSNEAPLPEGELLKCEAKCSVRLDDVYMVVDQGTVFSVTPAAGRIELFVQEGTVYYSLSQSSRPMHLNTPAGDATTGNLSLEETDLRGYLRVSGNKMEIGVIGGGTMMVQTASGEMAVTPGRQITISAIGSATGMAATEKGGLTRNEIIFLSAAGAGVVAAGIFALSSSGGGGGKGGGGGSPAAP